MHCILRSFAFILALAPVPALAQGRANISESNISLAGVTVTANKFQESTLLLAQKVAIIDSLAIEQSATNTSAALLEQSGLVFVQRSQQGGGSPVLRGFEANRVLLVVDGVRMNNAIYRAGHLQNIITVDDDMLSRVEILNGPSSTVYGSDALGGVIHLKTIHPELKPGTTGRPQYSGRISTRMNTAAQERTLNGRLHIGARRWAALTAVSVSDFGDLRSGNIRNPFYEDFGKREAYVSRINGVDSVVRNADVNVQKFSAYHQLDLMQKILFVPRPGTQHLLNVQFSTTGKVPRYDRLTDTRGGTLRWAEWHYGPQQRLMTTYQLERSSMKGFFDHFLLTTAWQDIQESRIQRAFRKNDQEHRVEYLSVLSYSADWRKEKGRHELNIGTDGQLNLLRSTAFTRDISSGQERGGLDTRYPNGHNRMLYLGVYAQHLYKLRPGKWIVNDGLRLNYSSLNATLSPMTAFPLPFDRIRQQTMSASANLSLVFLPGKRNKISGGVSTGFRVPNIDDMAKIFESVAGVQLIVPNPNLRPEQSLNFDLGFEQVLSDGLYCSVSAFSTFLRDAIVSDVFQFQGQDSVWYGGKMTRVLASQNKAVARILGAEMKLSYQCSKALKIYTQGTHTYGRFTGSSGSEVPMDHIPPFYGKTGLRYDRNAFSFDAYALYNGWKHLKDYNPFGEDNLQYATAKGMPSWYVLNLNMSYRYSKVWQMQAALENILDRNYRTFASGINAPGRNLIIKLIGNF